MSSIMAEKIDQAVAVLDETGVDVWLTFVRETVEAGDPVIPLILGQNLTWQSALIVSRTGERIAIVGKFDDEAVRANGVWQEVIPYVQSVREPLLEILRRLDPKTIAINFSPDDVKADGLSHGMFMLLTGYLAGTPYADRLVSADGIIGAARGRKSAGEIARMRAAIVTTDEIFDKTATFAAVGKTEREVAAFMKDLAAKHGCGLAWEPKMCPIVNTGPDSMIGHGIPGDLVIEPGHVLHIDFGVVQDDYCSDIQRCWYVPKAGETAPPEPVRHAFDTVAQAIQAAFAVIRPGVCGKDVDAAARQVVTGAGYPEFQHATGHQVGRSAHDGGSILGPAWERYGQTPMIPLEAGNVFTLEPGVEKIDGKGLVGLEEMVVVTDTGCEWLTTPQTTLPLLGS